MNALLFIVSFSTLITIAFCCQSSSTPQPSTTRLTTHRTTHRTTRRTTTNHKTTTTHPTTTQTQPTSSKTTTVRTTTGKGSTVHHKKKKNNDKLNCQKLNCMASTGTPCKYSAGGSGANGWGKVQHLGNPDTGIHDNNNGYFYGTSVSGGPQAISMSSPRINIQKPRLLKFQYYEATDNFNLKACVNSNTNCPFQSNLNAVPNDRAWRNGQLALPPGTHKVIFIANNVGNALGSAAVKNIVLYNAGSPSVPVCPNMSG